CGACSDPDTCGGNGIPSVCGHITLDTNMSDVPYAAGAFAQQFPDANNLCQVTGLQPAQQSLTSGPKTSPTFPADSVGYTWNNVSVYVTAAAQGTQFSADMTYTENGCTANYHVVGMWPAVTCTVSNMAPNDPKGLTLLNQVADPDLCNPCAEPDKGRDTGSGISPDFTTTCKQIFATTCDNANPPNCVTADPYGRDPFYCVLSGGDPPQLNPNPPPRLHRTPQPHLPPARQHPTPPNRPPRGPVGRAPVLLRPPRRRPAAAHPQPADVLRRLRRGQRRVRHLISRTARTPRFPPTPG